MKKLIMAAAGVFCICLCFAACKANNDQQPEGSNNNSNPDSSASISQVSENRTDDNQSDRTDEAENGIVTDDNGIIGDGDNKDNAMSDIVSDAVSGAQSIADNAGEGLQSVGEDIKNGVSNTAENIRDGISDAVSDHDETSENS